MGLLEQPVRVSGEILFGDTDLLSLSEKELNSVRGSRVGWIAQDPVAAMDPMVKVGGQMMEGVHFYQDGNDAKADGIRQLEEFGLADAQRVWDTYPFHLSGGMAQRVLTAMMTLPGPEWLIADEPTKGLDAFARRQAADAFRKLREKVWAFCSSPTISGWRSVFPTFWRLCMRERLLNMGRQKTSFQIRCTPIRKACLPQLPTGACSRSAVSRLIFPVFPAAVFCIPLPGV